MKTSQIFVAEIAEQISMPQVYSDIRTQIENPAAEIRDFESIIDRDRMLSSRLIDFSQSQYFGFPSRAKNLHQAISLIGTMQLHDLILNCLCMRTFSSIPQQIFNLRAFWKYSIECGIAARTLAQHAQIFPMNPFFTLGLLHEIGHAVMFVREPELSSQALDEAVRDQTPLIEKEQLLFGFDYTEVGAYVMQLWQLPDRFQKVCSQHLQPDQAEEMHLQAINIIHLAHAMCDSSDAACGDRLLADARQRDVQLSKLPGNIMEIVQQEIDSNSEDVLNMLLPYANRHDAADEGFGLDE